MPSALPHDAAPAVAADEICRAPDLLGSVRLLDGRDVDAVGVLFVAARRASRTACRYSAACCTCANRKRSTCIWLPRWMGSAAWSVFAAAATPASTSSAEGIAQARELGAVEAGEIGDVGRMIGRQSKPAHLGRDSQPAIVLHGARALRAAARMPACRRLGIEQHRLHADAGRGTAPASCPTGPPPTMATEVVLDFELRHGCVQLRALRWARAARVTPLYRMAALTEQARAAYQHYNFVVI